MVSLLATFAHFYSNEKLPYNIVMVASAEEESSGKNGLNSVLKHLPKLDCAIVGEPTLMQLAIAEKGLLVLDVIVKGTPSHAAHQNEDNPIYNAIPVIEWFNSFKFEKISEQLGPVKMTVTQINAGKQHNVVPSQCDLVVDIRVNDYYTNSEILAIIKKQLTAEINPRSMHLNASSIPVAHGLVQAGIALGKSNLWLTYSFGSVGIELSILEIGSWRYAAVTLRKRIYIYKRNRRRNSIVYQNTN